MFQSKQEYLNSIFNHIQSARTELSCMNGRSWPDGRGFSDADLNKIAGSLLRELAQTEINPEYRVKPIYPSLPNSKHQKFLGGNSNA
jgi:hypothetical protein